MFAENVEHVQQQIAEVASIERAQTILIKRVEPLPFAIGPGLVFQRVKIGGVVSAVFPAVDQPGQLSRRPALVVQTFSLDQLLEQAQLVIGINDRECRVQPDEFGMPSQHLGRNGVECAQPRHAFDRGANYGANPFAHFARRTVGKSDA